MSSPVKYVYAFGAALTEGEAAMKNLLGGKGANLAEMCRLGITVPPGFTISTEACTEFTDKGQAHVFELIRDEVAQGVARVEGEMGKRFGDPADPLLLSVRSGARASMPGMMDTILNLGLNDEAVVGLARKAGNERFAWDSYRRFIQMYGDVVMGLKPVSKEEHDPFEVIIDMVKEKRGVKLDTDLGTDDLKELVQRFKSLIRARIGRDFPTDPWEQLWGAVFAVFESWNNDRAKVYRELNDIPQSWGTAVNVQAMVFGNLGDSSATGVAFTRDAGTGEDLFNGEFLINAQGEDVVAGIRTPQQISRLGSQRWAQLALVSEEERRTTYPSLEELMPEIYQQLLAAETTAGEPLSATCRTWSSPSRKASSGCCRRATARACRPRPARPRADRVRCRRGRATWARTPRQGQGDPGAAGDVSPEDIHGMQRGQGHPHRARRHDLARGGGGARHGQALRLRRGAVRRLQGRHR
jgi:pyruvate,orthophosphate dikinase